MRRRLSSPGPLTSKPTRTLPPPAWPMPATALPHCSRLTSRRPPAVLGWCRTCCLAGLWCPPIWAKEIASRSCFGPPGRCVGF